MKKIVLLLIVAALCIQAVTGLAACHKEKIRPRDGTFMSQPTTLYSCKTCSSPRLFEDRLGAAGGKGSTSHTDRSHEQCTSCGTAKIGNEVHKLFLVAKKFKVHEGKHVPEGTCELLPKLGEFDPMQKSFCQETPCIDGNTGLPIGSGVNGKSYGSTDKTVCSRLCLLGGSLTRVTDLERYDDPAKRTGKRKVGSAFYKQEAAVQTNMQPRPTPPGGWPKMSEPVCGLHKTVMCTKNKDYDFVNCEKSGKPTHCKKENCIVEKNIQCVAILPRTTDYGMNGHIETKGSGATYKRSVKSSNVRYFSNECKHAINPCDMVALYV